MPKKKTGARKKAEKQKERQKEIRTSSEARSLVQQPCNNIMVSVFVKYLHGLHHVSPRSVTSVRGGRKIGHFAIFVTRSRSYLCVLTVVSFNHSVHVCVCAYVRVYVHVCVLGVWACPSYYM